MQHAEQVSGCYVATTCSDNLAIASKRSCQQHGTISSRVALSSGISWSQDAEDIVQSCMRIFYQPV